MKNVNLALTLLAAAGLALTACSGNSPNLTQPPVVIPTAGAAKYIQIELLSRPAIKEVFEPFQDHQKSNTAEPYNDGTIDADIVATEDALRPPTTTLDYGKTLASVLYPNEYLVNLSGGAPPAATGQYFLSTELSGGTSFGGRAPNDDVVGLELAALFGNALSAVGVIADDHEENNCLSAQNISTHDPAKLSTSNFPYLPAPR
jgi:Domain of unknown function (DUF4331)